MPLLLLRDLGACDKQEALIIRRCNPTAAQKPAAAEGNTMREAAHPRCIGACNPSPRIGRAGGADAYTPTTLHHPQPPREKLTPSLQRSSISCCCAGGSSVRFSSNYACWLSPFAYLCTPDHHHAASLLFGQRCRDCFWFLVCCYRFRSKVCVIIDALRRYTASSATGSSSSQRDFYRQPRGQQQY